ncbi:MAG: hypothetical protein JOZ83_15765 [Silvibacterium sp.]|nr:hypothetical protein [Silvibacterium sp.]
MQPGNPSSSANQIARALLLAMLCAAPALICFRTGAAACVGDPDLGWHLRTGEWILQHHAVPRADIYSRFGAGKPWQAYSWLFEVLLTRLYQWFRFDGVMVYMGIMLSAIAAALFRLTSRLQPDFTRSTLLTMAILTALSRLYTPRPWLFTILFFILEIDILMHARRTGESRRLLWLPPLFALWANIHIQFIDGLMVLGLAACEPVLARWWKPSLSRLSARSLWIALPACIAAACVNPYGAGIYKVAHALAAQPGVLNTISEMHALPFRSMMDFLLLFLAMAAVAVMFRFHRLFPFETLMLAMALWLSFRSQRDIWFLAIVAAVILAEGLPIRSSSQQSGRESLWTVPLSFAATALLVLVSAFATQIRNDRLEGKLAEEMPLKAVQVVREHQYSGALYNTYGWGGFLIWNLREPVSIDGRAAFYGDERIDRSMKTWNGGPDWASDPDLKSAGLVIAPVDAALTQLLRMDSRFELAYQDKVAAVFVARSQQQKNSSSVATLSPAGKAHDPEKRL